MTASVLFDERAIEAFMGASHDRNPLHYDERYASRTQFGHPIVYGVCGVIAALGKWSAGRRFSLRTLRVKFERPLFYGQHYSIKWIEKGTDVQIKVLQGETVNIKIALSYDDRSAADRAPPAARAFAPLNAPLAVQWTESELTAWTGKKLSFGIDPIAVRRLLDLAELAENQIPQPQLAFLLWASYFVGMQVPGKQALFSELNAEFDGEEKSFPNETSEIEEIQFDGRFNRIVATGKISKASRFDIIAYVRPNPVNSEIGEIKKLALEPERFRGRTFVISGGTRGFGEAIAKVAALQGGAVGLNYRASADEAKRVLTELSEVGCRAAAFQGDVGETRTAEELLQSVLSEFGRVDYCICNASPPIEARKFSDLGADGFALFTTRSLAPTLGLLSAFLKVAPAGAMAVLISSVYASGGKSEFSHYAAAKAAQEKAFESLAKEYPRYKFLVARLPKILTDQTNVAFDREPPHRAVDVALALSEAVANFPDTSNFQHITLDKVAS